MQSPASIRMVELDPATGKPKRRMWRIAAPPGMLDLREAQHVAALLCACEKVMDTQRVLYDEALRLARYTDRLSRRINLEILPGDEQDIGSTSHRVGELGELESRRAGINCVAKAAKRCVDAKSYQEALARLVALDCGNGD